MGLPAIIRPSFTLGGTGAGIAYTDEEFDRVVDWGLQQSPRHQILIEQSVLGWKEYELEVMRDTRGQRRDHLLDRELRPDGRAHRRLDHGGARADADRQGVPGDARRASLAIIREIGVDTGGSNIQFAVNPKDGAIVVIEMNPRVSRSSALASKATGFPIAKIAAKLAVGYTLDEIPNDITQETPASLRADASTTWSRRSRASPSRSSRRRDPTLTTQMKSVGEVMAIGRTFKESFQKAIRSLEIGHAGLERPAAPDGGASAGRGAVGADRGAAPGAALGGRRGAAPRRVASRRSTRRCGIDPWFLRNLLEIVETEQALAAASQQERVAWLRPAKQMGFSDRRLAALWNTSEDDVRALRHAHGVRPVYKRVDTCAAEFEAHTPYLYSTYEQESEAEPTDRQKVMILGGGPNRIGQGIEFDYCCVHAVFALRDAGFETIMVNCNPETVSTDYDTSDRLYFEPLTLEDVLEIVRAREAARRDRAVRRPDAAAARGAARARRRADPRHAARRDRPRRGPRALRGAAREARPRAAALGHRTQRRRGRDASPSGSATRCWCGPPTCSAAARWRSCTTSRRCASTCASR